MSDEEPAKFFWESPREHREYQDMTMGELPARGALISEINHGRALMAARFPPKRKPSETQPSIIPLAAHLALAEKPIEPYALALVTVLDAASYAGFDPAYVCEYALECQVAAELLAHQETENRRRDKGRLN